MGQKSHPIGLRLGINKNWSSNWMAKKKEFKGFILEDFKIRKFLFKNLKNAGLSRVNIERDEAQIKIIIYTSKPGIIIGRGGVGAEEIKSKLAKITKKNIDLEIKEVESPEKDAALVAQNIASQIEKRISWRKAVKQSIARAQEERVKGIRISVSGRLGGVEMARRENFAEGSMPLGTFKANIDYSFCEAKTTYGVIGVKVWIYQ